MFSETSEKFDKVLAATQETLGVCMFMASFSLLGKKAEEQKKLAKIYSIEIAKLVLREKRAGLNFTDIAPTIESSLLATKPENFSELVKNFISRKAAATGISCGSCFVSILHQVINLEKNPENFIRWELKKRSVPLFIFEKKNRVNDSDQYEQITLDERAQTWLKQNETIHNFLAWSDVMDKDNCKVVSDNKKLDEAARALIKDSHHWTSFHIATLSLIFALALRIYYPAFFEFTSEVTGGIIVACAVSLTVYFAKSYLLKSYNKLCEVEKETKQKINIEQFEKTLDECLTVKLVKTLDPITQQTKQHISLSLPKTAAQAMSSLNTWTPTQSTTLTVKKKIKEKPTKHVTRMPTGHPKSSETYVVEYTSTSRFYERVVAYQASKICVRLPREFLNSLPQPYDKMVLNKFKHAFFTGGNRFQVLSSRGNKEQIELTLPGLNKRVFGEKQLVEDKEVYVLNRLANGLH